MTKKKEKPSALLQFSGAGIQMAVIIGAGALLGTYLDKEYNKEFFTLTCTLAAVLVAVIYFVKKAIDLSKDA